MSRQAPDPDSADVRELMAKDLLFAPPDKKGGQVKFYWSLTRTSTNTSLDSETSTLLRAIREVGVSSSASLYTGVGNFTSYLLRCVAKDYASVLKITAKLDTYLMEMSVERTTFLLANSSARESDNINGLRQTGFTRDDLHELTSDVLGLGPDATDIFARLPPGQRDALHSLLVRTHEIARDDDALREKLRTLLRACLRNDPEEVTAALGFLFDTEYFLGEYLKTAWGQRYGDWMSYLAKEFERAPGTARYATQVRAPEDWTLGTLVGMISATAETDPKLDALFGQDLGPRWKTQLLRLREIRNKVAHGQVRRETRLDDFAGSWGQSLTVILEDIAPLRGTLQKLRRRS